MYKKSIIIFCLICACNLQAQVWAKVINSVPGFFQATTMVKDTINNLIYFGGHINTYNNVFTNGVVKFDGTNFDTLQSGVGGNGGIVKDLRMFQNKLYVFGSFENTGIYNCPNIGRWNGTSWDNVNFKPNQPIWWSDVYNNELYVSGWFDTIAGLPIKRVAKFDGTNWHSLSFPYADRTQAIKGYKGKIYAASYTGLWVYSNNSWTNLADCKGDMFRHVYGMNVIDSVLYIYGRFNSIGGSYSKGIAAYDGEKWYTIGQGMSYSGYEIINNVQKIDGKIIITGNFDKIEGIGTSNFSVSPSQSTNYAELENNQWCLKSAGFDNATFGAVKYNGNLYMYGAFWKCGSDSVVGVAKWNGGTSSVICSNSVTTTYSYVGINENNILTNTLIYPNPFNNKFTINTNSTEPHNLTITNTLGQVILTQTLTEQTTEIDLSLYSNGIYFTQLSYNSYNKTFKMIKN